MTDFLKPGTEPPPWPASSTVYFIIDGRNCREDRDAAMAAARAMDGFDEGYITVYRVDRPTMMFAPLLNAMPDEDDDNP